MKKQLVILGIVVLFICVGLSGCEEKTGNGGDTTGDTSKVELVSYDVKTTWQEPTKYSENWNDPYDYVEKQQEGFFHISHPDSRYERYTITGTVRNIAGYKLDEIMITAKLYDSDGIYLTSSGDSVYDIPDTYSEDFEIVVSGNYEYFDNIESVKFEISAE